MERMSNGLDFRKLIIRKQNSCFQHGHREVWEKANSYQGSLCSQNLITTDSYN